MVIVLSYKPIVQLLRNNVTLGYNLLSNRASNEKYETKNSLLLAVLDIPASSPITIIPEFISELFKMDHYFLQKKVRETLVVLLAFSIEHIVQEFNSLFNLIYLV